MVGIYGTLGIIGLISSPVTLFPMKTAMDAATDFDGFQISIPYYCTCTYQKRKEGRKKAMPIQMKTVIYNSMRVHKEKQLHVY